MFSDPYPRRLWLGRKEIMSLLGFDRSTWYEFRRDPTTGFPAPLDAGATASGARRERWDKAEIYRWMLSRPRVQPGDAEGRPKAPETRRNRPKPSGGVADEET